MRTNVGMSSLIGCAVPARISASTTPTIWLQHRLELPFEDVVDLNIGVASGITSHYHRVVAGIDGGGAADHPFGELLRRFVGLTRREVLREFFKFLRGIGKDLREHRVLGIEVKVETGPRHPGPIADGADRQLGERCLLEEIPHSLHDRLSVPVAPPARHRRALRRRGGTATHPADLALRTSKNKT